MTAPVVPPKLTAEVSIDASDPARPVVVLRLKNEGIAADFRIEAPRAAEFGVQLGQGLVAAAQQALAMAAPALLTPPKRLFVPGPGATPTNGAGR